MYTLPCWIYIIPSLVYFFQYHDHVLISYGRLICYLLEVSFHYKYIILLESKRPIEDLPMFLKPFLLRRTFFAYFRLMKQIMVFFELFFDFPIRWQPSMSWAEAFTAIFWVQYFSNFLVKLLVLYIIWNSRNF